jgi:diguanylate cyclase (GGDEF)-like protein/PAS domain S-box-containing protein
MNPFFRILMQLAVLTGIALVFTPAYGAEPVRIGVLAVRPKLQALAQWQPLAVALKQAIPERDFVVEALTFPELNEAVVSRQFDFVLTNPGHYVLLTKRSGLSAPLATLAGNSNGQPTTVFGGVIFSRAGQANINALSDLKGKTIAVTSIDSLGGYQMEAYDLKLAGISLPQDAKLISTGMPHDNVVEAVLAGHADVGFVRSGVLEGMAREGKLNMAQLKIINRQNFPDFPAQVSTRLYPEWTFAALPNVDRNLARHVVAVLFLLAENTAATRAMNIYGFDIPSDYTPVVDLLRELRLPPFDTAPAFDLQDVWMRYRWQMTGTLLASGLILLLYFRLFLTKRKLEATHRAGLRHQQQLQESERKYSNILESVDACIYLKDTQGRYLYANHSLRELFGSTLEEIVGQRDERFYNAESTVQLHNHDRLVLEKGETIKTEETNLNLKGRHTSTYLTVKLPLRNEAGEIYALCGISTDITERKQAEEELRIAATTFESQEGMMVTDANLVILRVNHAFTDITGYTCEDVIGQTPRILSSGLQEKDFFTRMWDSINGTDAWEGEIWNRRKNGEVYPEHLTITAVKDIYGTVTNYVASLTDITLSKAAADEIKSLAFYDPLTSLPNRRLLSDRLTQALATRARSGNNGALLFLDLDHFKTLNDTLGHDIGDLLLQQVAERLTDSVREGDTVARLSGDEFVVLLEDLSEQALEAAAQTDTIGIHILAALNQPYQLATHQYHCSTSIGATLFNGHEKSVEELLKQADIAMYQAKASGRNALRFFDPNMQATITARVELEADLRKALAENQFELYFQPQVQHSGQIIGAEVLIRWHHPLRGLVSPAEFVPLAEETRLILPIGQWVLEKACAQIKSWEGSEHTRLLQLAVNVSVRQFFQVGFLDQVIQILSHTGINPAKLKLELTESLVLDDIDDTIFKMHALKNIGVRFSMDDFGTGYSSLSSLKKLPLDQLKIDQSFVRDISIDRDDAIIVETIIAMANKLGMEVIAEGVETETQRAFLEQHGCLLFQGYLVSKPVPIEQFEMLIKRNLVLLNQNNDLSHDTIETHCAPGLQT